jgi:hypothetical protein
MAETKTYVDIPKFAVLKIDDKHKSRVVDLMTKTATAAVKKSGKLTVDKSRDGKGWSLDGSLVSIGPDKAGKKFAAEVSMTVAALPGRSIKSMSKGLASFGIDNADHVRASDFEAAAEAAVDSAMKSALKFMEANRPE